MTTSVSPFAFAFNTPTTLPKLISRVTPTTMGLILPRLEASVVDESGNTDPTKKDALDKLIEKYRAIYAVGGRISATKLTKGKGDDPGVRFVGEFKAFVKPSVANTNVGDFFVSSRCHVPRFFEEVLYAQVLAAKKRDANSLIEILVGVGLKPPMPGKPSITGYEWTVEPLVDMSTADDAVDLLFARGRERIALAAPTSPPIVETTAQLHQAAEKSRESRRAS